MDSSVNDLDLKKFLSIINASQGPPVVVVVQKDLEQVNADKFKSRQKIKFMCCRVLWVTLAIVLLGGVAAVVAVTVFKIKLFFPKKGKSDDSPSAKSPAAGVAPVIGQPSPLPSPKPSPTPSLKPSPKPSLKPSPLPTLDRGPLCSAISVTATTTTAGASCSGGVASNSPTCTFTCAPGYLATGAMIVTCDSSGKYCCRRWIRENDELL